MENPTHDPSPAALEAACPDVGVGVVLLHGKAGTPTGRVADLAAALQRDGFRVAVPTMPWAEDRIYSASYEDALRQIDGEVRALRREGAGLVAVAGHSLGANAAIGYGAWTHADAIVALAPAHYPDQTRMRERFAADVSRARELIAAGRGGEKQTFSDLNQDTPLQVTATAEAYLSWFDPEGPAVMPRNAAAFKAPTPLLVVIGAGERTARWRHYFFDKAPPHPKSAFTVVSGEHVEVPDRAIAQVQEWLRRLEPGAGEY